MGALRCPKRMPVDTLLAIAEYIAILIMSISEYHCARRVLQAELGSMCPISFGASGVRSVWGSFEEGWVVCLKSVYREH